MCLDFLKSLRERPGAAPSPGMSTFAAAFPALGSQSRGVGKATPTGVLPPSEKKKNPHRSPFVPLQTLRHFLAGRGSYFVYV